MRRITGAFVAVLAAGLFTACGLGAGGDDSAADEEAASALEEADAEAAREGADAPQDADAAAGSDDGGQGAGEVAPGVAAIDLSPRHIIYRVDLFIETDDIERATQRAAAIASTSGGFVAEERTSVGDDGLGSASLTLRVPAADHLGVVEQLEQLGEVRERGRSAEDVTEEVTDVESRIDSQRRSIDRIRQLLAQASDLDDVVRIESELARREADLDSLLQRQATLSDLTSLATVTVTFHQPGEPDDDPFPPTFLAGLRTGWNAFVETIAAAGGLVGVALPFIAAAAVVGVPVWLVWRRRRMPPLGTATTPPAPAAADGPGTASS